MKVHRKWYVANKLILQRTRKGDIYRVEERMNEQVQLTGPGKINNHMNSAAIMLSLLIRPNSSKG